MRIYLLLLGLLLANCSEQNETGESRPPNVILILTDDQGWGDLSLNGNTNFSTPNIDAIGENGVSFHNFYVQPVCSPTRAEILTGRHFTKLGVYATSAGGERMNLGETTIAEVFKSAGYQTAAFGKWHNGMQPPYHPNNRGFDEYYGFASGHWGHYFDPMLEHNGELVRGNGYLPDDLTDKALDYIEANQEKPFFVYLPYNTPHSPMQVPNAYWDNYKSKSLPMRYKDSLEENVNFTRAALAMVENIDDNIGRIHQKLAELQLEENTILVFLTDNGPNGWRWNGGMRGRKGSTDEGGVRSPLLIQWKNTIPQNKSLDQLSASIDLLPTLAGLTNIDIKTTNPIDGMDLSERILSEAQTTKDRILYHHWNGKTSLRSQRFRLDTEDRLYDIRADRGQNVIVDSLFSAIRDSLVKEKKTWLASFQLGKEGDSRPLPLGYPGSVYTQIPARDGMTLGGIIRSNRYPNCSFFTNWTSTEDVITWDVDVMETAMYEVVLYYTCKPENVGGMYQLSHGPASVSFTIEEAHDPPEYGMDEDRDPRIESYVKDFKPMSLGKVEFKEGRGLLTLTANELVGGGGIDVRLLQFIKQ